MPVWNRTISLVEAIRLYKTDGDIPATAAKVVEIIEASGWLNSTSHPEGLRAALDRLKKTEDAYAYTRVFDYIYDIADLDRVWIETS